MSKYKFDDCYECRFRRAPDVCADCDSGEMFEDITVKGLDFSYEASYRRNDTSLVTDDDEPTEIDPTVFLERMDDPEEGEDDE